MTYKIAGIDVHKKMLAVVVADVAVEGEYEFEHRKFSTSPDTLRLLAEWLIRNEVEEVVMESTAQYWKPVWQALERYWKPARQKREDAVPSSGAMHLAQAKSNRGPRGRKNDLADAQRLIKRLVADELVLSFVPDPEQRLWRTVTRKRYQLTSARVRLQNQLEALLEEAHIQLSSNVSDLLGVSGRRMTPSGLPAVAETCAGRVGPPRATNAPAGPGDLDVTDRTSGCGSACGRDARLGSGFGAPDHRRDWGESGALRHLQGTGIVGGRLPG
jgi:hypothetical protein